MIRINKTEELKAKLTREGQKVAYLDEPQHIEAIMRMNDEMDEVRRDFKVKDENSQASAANLVLTS